MAIFVRLSTLADDERKTIKKNPDTIKEADKEVEEISILSLVSKSKFKSNILKDLNICDMRPLS